MKTLEQALNEEHTLPNQPTHTPHNTTNSTEQHNQKLMIQESKKRTFHTIKGLAQKHLANVKKEIAEINQTTEEQKQETINTITNRHKELLQKELSTLVQQGHISAEIARRVAQPACQLIDFPGQTKMDDTFLHQFERLCARWSQLNHWKPSIDNVLKAIALGTKQKELHKLTSHEARAPHASAITSATDAAQPSNRTHTSKDKGKALSSSNASGKKKANAVEPSAKHRKRASHSNNQRNSPEEGTQQLPEEIVAEILKYVPLDSRSK